MECNGSNLRKSAKRRTGHTVNSWFDMSDVKSEINQWVVSTFPQVFRAELIGVFDQHLCHPCRGTNIQLRLQSRLNPSLISHCLQDRKRKKQQEMKERKKNEV